MFGRRALINVDMRVICAIQARMSSRRLPGKILLTLRDRPSLAYLVESLTHARQLDGAIIATSTDATDDPTAGFAAERRIPCYRGSLTNVAQRLLEGGEACGADAIVRVSGDSPLLDPKLVDEAVELFRGERSDVVTNVRPRSFPKGQSVEVVAISALRQAVASMSTGAEREHVTPYLYAHPEQFLIRAFVTEHGRPEVQLSVDDREDHERCAKILEHLSAPPWEAGWRACVAAYDRVVSATEDVRRQ